jgi:ABC-type glutathione transport system ATPase component
LLTTGSPPAVSPLVDAESLSLEYRSAFSFTKVLSNISFDLQHAGALGVLGESGSGKTSLALALLGLLPANARIEAQRLSLCGQDVRALTESEWRSLRGVKVGYIAQEPNLALNPVIRVGDQITEVAKAHSRDSRRQCEERAQMTLARLCPQDADRLFHSYPHQLSGGQKQRVLIAQAVVNSPALIIADEPTSALDASVQAEILDLLASLRKEKNTALLVISHNPAVVAQLASRVLVLQRGNIVESGDVNQVFSRPQHPFTQQLLEAARELVL